MRSVILHKYGVDIAQEYFTHIDFAQSYGVDGASAGVTMAILLCSLIEGKPIRQDVAVTGEINIGVDDSIQVTVVAECTKKSKPQKCGLQKSHNPSEKLPVFNRSKRL